MSLADDIQNILKHPVPPYSPAFDTPTRGRVLNLLSLLTRTNQLDNLWTRNLGSKKLSDSDAKLTAAIGREISHSLREAIAQQAWISGFLKENDKEVGAALEKCFGNQPSSRLFAMQRAGGNWSAFAQQVMNDFFAIAESEAAEIDRKTTVLLSGGHTPGDLGARGKCRLLFAAAVFAALSAEVAFAVYLIVELDNNHC